MMRADSKGRSASPHRITYKSDFHAIKCSFDTGTSLQPWTKAAAAAAQLSDPIMSHTSSSTGSRGRVHSTRGTKIRENIFLQMDSQQLKQDAGPVPSSGSAPLLSPNSPSLQPQTSPFPGSRRSFLSSSSVLSSVANISNPESSLQDRPSRSEEMANIDRAALAQKFSVTRRLFETKVSEGIAARGSKGMTEGKVDGKEGTEDVSQMDKEEESSGKRKHTQEASFDKYKSTNVPIINSTLPKPHVQASPSRDPNSPLLAGRDASHTSPSYHNKCHNAGSQKQNEGAESATFDLCLTPEEPVRAELVDVKNESSESDENEEVQVFNGAKDEGETNMSKVSGEGVQDLVDDVFEELSVDTMPYSSPVVPSECHQKKLLASISSEGETKHDEERGGDKYWQVNEQWEGPSRQFIAQGEKSAEKEDCREKKTDAGVEEGARRQESGMKQEEGVDKEDESYSVGKRKGGEETCKQSQRKERTEKEVRNDKNLHATEQVECEESRGGSDGKDGGQEDQMGSEVICGTETFVCERESRNRPEHSTPPRQEWEDSARAGNQLLLQYEEIPGLPEVADEEDADAAEVTNRMVRFSSAPIKVRKKKKEGL